MLNRQGYGFLAVCVLLWLCALTHALSEKESKCADVKKSSFEFWIKDDEKVELKRLGANGECAVVKWEKKLVVICNGSQDIDLDYSVGTKFKWVALAGGQSALLLTDEGTLKSVYVSEESEKLSVKLDEISFDQTVISVEPHPKRGGSLLALTRKSKEESSTKELYYSSNSGKNWKKLLDEDVEKVSWAHLDVFDTSDVVSFYYVAKHGKDGSKLHRATFEVAGLPETYQGLKTVEWPESNHVLDFKVEDEGKLFLVVEKDGKKVMERCLYNFSKCDKILFPDRVESVESFSMLKNGPALYLGLAERDQDDRATLYVFNSDRGSFATNLKNVVARSTQGEKPTMDVVSIEGLNDIMLANVWVDDNKVQGQGKPSENENDRKTMETRITFHAGSYWSSLKAPEGDCSSDEPCKLNLLSVASGSKEVSPKSTDLILGLVLAVGSTSANVKPKGDVELNTYMSIDAGKTWKKVVAGSSLFDYTMSKTHILVVPSKADNQFLYSSTYGESWDTCNFLDDDKASVDGNTEPTKFHSILPFSKSKFLVVGSSPTSSGTFLWRMIVLDFDSNNTLKSCNLNPGNVDLSDYDYWVPSDFTETGCIAGKKTAYIRRRPLSQCIPDPMITSIIFKQISCTCAPVDYLCDYCYAPVIEPNGDRRCVLECPNYDPSSPPSNCVDFWVESTGYTLVPGDKCLGGDQLQGLSKQCPKISPSYSLSKIYIILSVIFVLLIFTLAFLLWHSAAHSVPIRNFLSKFLPDRFLPRKVTENESWGLYHPLDNPNSAAINENDIFNDDEFLKEDPNILDLEEEQPARSSSQNNE
ncbi:uncharacterized protein LOC126316744 [Schistocerca gregaria]|uniref:uncharacterized protein LOC126316744 n=1 Tax=Schistocerca gregaria TaxID=7010 RepID=UPI00211F2A58|nr:uncharacterized protein LOC126316744 [Schistocerca gregaria]